MGPCLAGVLHPELLWLGVAAGAVPILIHLLSRRRVRPLPWAAMRWLLAAVKKHQRRLRLENLLVLLLRVAALVLLGLGLAHVILADSSLAALLRPKRSWVLLVDTSYSTAAKDGARSVSDRIRAEAERVLSAVGPSDALVVVASNERNDDPRGARTGTRPKVVMPRTVGREAVARAREALASLRPTEAPAPWTEALTACLPKAVLQPADSSPTLVWVTDLQAADWRRPDDASKPDALARALEALHREDVAIRVIDAGGGREGHPLGNLAVTGVQRVGNLDLFQGQSFRLAVTLANHGERVVERATLRVFLDDLPAPAWVNMAPTLPPADPLTGRSPPQDVMVEIPREMSFKTPGSHAVRVEVTPPDSAADADALALDSRRFRAIDVRSTVKVACWVESNRVKGVDTFSLLRGVFMGEGAGDLFDLRAAADEAGLRALLSDAAWEPDLVVLANRVPRGAETQRDLVAFVKGGGALLVFPGEAIKDPHLWNDAFHDNPAGRLMPFRYGTPEYRKVGGTEKPWTIDFDRGGLHPLAARLTGKTGEWIRRGAPPAIRLRLPLLQERVPPAGTTPRPAPGAEEEAVILRFEGEGGMPGPVAVAEAPFGQGHALFAAFPADIEWIEEGIVFFLPVLVYDAALSLTRAPEAGRNLLVGEPIQSSVPRDATNLRLQVPGRGEEAPAVRRPASEAERPLVIHERVGTSGLWRLAYERPPARGSAASGPKKVEESFAVNPDPAEGSLAKAARETVRSRAQGVDIDVLDTWSEGTASAEGGRKGDLAPWILMAVLAVLLVEGFLAMRFGHHERVRTKE